MLNVSGPLTEARRVVADGPTPPSALPVIVNVDAPQSLRPLIWSHPALGVLSDHPRSKLAVNRNGFANVGVCGIDPVTVAPDASTNVTAPATSSSPCVGAAHPLMRSIAVPTLPCASNRLPFGIAVHDVDETAPVALYTALNAAVVAWGNRADAVADGRLAK